MIKIYKLNFFTILIITKILPPLHTKPTIFNEKYFGGFFLVVFVGFAGEEGAEELFVGGEEFHELLAFFGVEF